MKKKLEKIEWEAPEYEFHEKSPDWFWTLGIITLALFLSAVLLHSFLFGFLILLAGFSLALFGARKPNIVSLKVNAQGIHIGNRIYPYENLKCFWVDYEPPYKKEIIIESKKTFMPHLTIMIGDADPVKIRNYLLKFLKEEKIEEPLTSTIARVLRF
jgi:hypothetical protein